jgi:hypothetical protein
MSPNPNGYLKRPWELTVLAVFFALVPFLSSITRFFASLVAGHPESPVQILAGLFGTAGNGPLGLAHGVLMAMLWALFLVVAWGIFRVVRWGFVLCMVAAVANSLFSTLLYSVSKTSAGLVESVSFNPFQLDVLLNLVFFVPVILLLRQKIMAPFFNPRMKWWEQHPRVKALLKIEAAIDDQKKFYQSFDISESGMFLGTTEFPDLPVGGRFPASIHLEELNTVVNVLCEAVWISDGSGRSPMGVGVTFQYPQRGQKKVLGRYIKTKIREGLQLERV